ncbi:MAG: DUF1330 domain-containing protein [Acidimicrobiales bacterium]
MSEPDVRMHGGEGGINPTAEQLAAVVAAHPTGSIQMVNLLKYRERAAYPADYAGDPSPDCSGAEAYQRYGAVAYAHVTARGGRFVLYSDVDGVVLGDMGHDEWDQVAIVEYPSVDAFLDMGQDPDYLAATVHRTAGLERSVILATTAIIDASAPPA